MNQWKRALISLLLLFFAIISDGLIALYGGQTLNTMTGIMVPHLTVLVLVILANFVRIPLIYYLAVLFGFIYDSYYVGFFGIYTVGFFAISYVTGRIWQKAESNILIYILMGLLGTLMIEVFAFAIYSMLDITEWTPEEFFVYRMGATLVFNGAMMGIICWFIDRLMKKIQDDSLYLR